MKIRKWG